MHKQEQQQKEKRRKESFPIKIVFSVGGLKIRRSFNPSSMIEQLFSIQLMFVISLNNFHGCAK